ncbi:MAG: aminoacyl-tRNA hydrolase [Actinomycetaceae bacterium]|nr:aminoacyl-tRNA hydrolase [Actinomycetaceae bacterium]
MYVIVGLGNPGNKYAGNRHNIGYMVVDELAKRAHVSLKQLKNARAQVASIRVPGSTDSGYILGMSNSFMNESGGPVRNILDYFRVAPEKLIIIHDDLDLPFERLKLKKGGGEGGHNGLKSITTTLKTPDYIRMRVGIGRPPQYMEVSDYVLRDFTKEEKIHLPLIIDRTCDAIDDVMNLGLEKATMRLHTAA